MRDRHLAWPGGCWNARDLGGLPTWDGRSVRWGALVRSDAPDHLTRDGWAALQAHGVRTIVDLRNDDERAPDAAPRPAGLSTLHLPLDGLAEDPAFWERWGSGPQFGTPLYYRPHLRRFPHLSARVVAAIAQAPPGGMLIHCVGGRDRTGQIVALVLALLGVPIEVIAADHALSADRLRRRYEALGEPDQGPLLAAFLADQGTTAAELVAATLQQVDVEATLRAGGLGKADVAALRERCLV